MSTRISHERCDVVNDDQATVARSAQLFQACREVIGYMRTDVAAWSRGVVQHVRGLLHG